MKIEDLLITQEELEALLKEGHGNSDYYMSLNIRLLIEKHNELVRYLEERENG